MSLKRPDRHASSHSATDGQDLKTGCVCVSIEMPDHQRRDQFLPNAFRLIARICKASE